MPIFARVANLFSFFKFFIQVAHFSIAGFLVSPLSQIVHSFVLDIAILQISYITKLLTKFCVILNKLQINGKLQSINVHY